MKNLLIISFLVSFIFTQGTTSYSWEDGTGTILGYYYEISNPTNVGITNGISPYDATYMLSVSESPNNDNTPQAYIAFIENLSPGDQVTASFYGWDDTAGDYPKLRIWGAYALNGDITAYQGSAGGSGTYSSGTGWEKLEHTWTIEAGEEALVIQARLYSSVGVETTQYFIDLVSVTSPDNATVTYPGDPVTGCTDADAYNYNPNATEACNGDNSCCEYLEQITIAEARALGVGHPVIVQGVITSPNWFIHADYPDAREYSIQDATAGVILFGFDLIDLDLAIGNEVRITGETDEYNGKFEVMVGSLADIEIINIAAEVPEPQLITVTNLYENGEDYESELITIENVEPIGGDPWPTEGNWANITISDNGGLAITTLRIDDDTDIDGSSEPGWPIAVTGVGGQFDYSEPYDEYYQIIPRFTTDFQGEPGMPVANAGPDQFVAPGELVTLDGSLSYDTEDEEGSTGTIIAYEWTQSSGEDVGITGAEDAMVTFTAPDTYDVLVFELNVWDDDDAANYNEDADEITITVLSPIDIYDIQYTETAEEGGTYDCYPSPYGTYLDEQIVQTTGIVTAVKPEYPNFYISQSGADIWGGIYVYDDDYSPVIGDLIIITGTIREEFGFTQIEDVIEYSSVSAGHSISPVSISTGALGMVCSLSGEKYEGMLVQVSNVTVEAVDTEYGNFTINDGSGSTKVDNFIFDGDWSYPSIGETFDSITGAVQYYFGEYLILPRVGADISEPDAPDPYCGDGICNGSETEEDCPNDCSFDDLASLFFSEYAEGSSNNKYLEIYNATGDDVDLGGYSLSSCANGCNDGVNWDYPDNLTFETGTTVAAGDVYVVCHGSSDDFILAECDHTFTYLSNGNDVLALTQIGSGEILDIIGTIGEDPGSGGWEVAGVSNATKDHTLVRKSSVGSGNGGDWASSAGMDAGDSEWVVWDQNTWTYLGSHPHDFSSTCDDDTACNYGEEGDCAFAEEGYDCDGNAVVDVTFQVNMAEQTVDTEGYGLALYLPDPYGYHDMSDDDGDGVWSVTLTLVANTTYSYKFKNGEEWEIDFNDLGCGAGDEYGNRTFTSTDSDMDVGPFCFNSCTDCADDCGAALGDVNGDTSWNVLDIVVLAGCVLADNCDDLDTDGLGHSCAGDLNGDGGWNVLDIVSLANCVLADNCEGLTLGRVLGNPDDASESKLIILDNMVSLEAEGFVETQKLMLIK